METFLVSLNDGSRAKGRQGSSEIREGGSRRYFMTMMMIFLAEVG